MWRSRNHLAEAGMGVYPERKSIPPALAHQRKRGGGFASSSAKVGDRFGLLVIACELERTQRGIRWVCRCDCGRDAVRLTAQLNQSVRQGYEPACRECLDEVRRSCLHLKRERRAEAFRAQYVDLGTLWTFDQSERLSEEVLSDLRREFGDEEELDEEMTIAVGYPYSFDNFYSEAAVKRAATASADLARVVKARQVMAYEKQFGLRPVRLNEDELTALLSIADG